MSRSTTSYQEQCKGKIKYHDIVDARAACKEVVTKFEDGPEMNYYLCPHCVKWHVGRMINAEKSNDSEVQISA